MLEQPVLGLVASALVIAFSLGFVALFPAAKFLGSVTYCLLCIIPMEIVIGVTWGYKQPGFAAKRTQPARGALLAMVAAIIGVEYAESVPEQLSRCRTSALSLRHGPGGGPEFYACSGAITCCATRSQQTNPATGRISRTKLFERTNESEIDRCGRSIHGGGSADSVPRLPCRPGSKGGERPVPRALEHGLFPADRLAHFLQVRRYLASTYPAAEARQSARTLRNKQMASCAVRCTRDL